jgi:hypothetical protein
MKRGVAGAASVVSNASGNCFAFSRKVTVTLKPDAAVAEQILELQIPRSHDARSDFIFVHSCSEGAKIHTGAKNAQTRIIFDDFKTNILLDDPQRDQTGENRASVCSRDR